jgi:hypothetical protein
MPRTGGGINSKPVVQTRNPKVEPTVHNIDPRRPSQIGMSVHYVKTDLYQSTTTPKGPTNLMTAGPGSGRQILPCGTQARSVTRPMPKGRDLFR